MPCKAAMVLTFDIVPEAIVEHDDWHTHEHLPERLSIPGFRRGSRWTAQQGQPRYFVLYEVDELGILNSAPYLERLNNPTPWTAKMMTSYRGMSRGLCRVSASAGAGLGTAGLLVQFRPSPGKETALRKWLTEEILPDLPSKPGLTGAHLMEAGLTPQFTNEQRIRGRDAAVDWVLLVAGYDPAGVASLAKSVLGAKQFSRHGSAAVTSRAYRMDFSLTRQDLGEK